MKLVPTVEEGKRKFTVAMWALTTSFILALLDKLSSDWVLTVTAIVGLFGAANYLVHSQKR